MEVLEQDALFMLSFMERDEDLSSMPGNQNILISVQRYQHRKRDCAELIAHETNGNWSIAVLVTHIDRSARFPRPETNRYTQ